MPVDLPVRKVLASHPLSTGQSEALMRTVAALCVMLALTGLISQTPRGYRDGLTAVVYQDMLLGP